MRTRAESCSSSQWPRLRPQPVCEYVVRYSTGHVPPYRTDPSCFLPVAVCPAFLPRRGKAHLAPACELQTGKCQPHQKKSPALADDPRCPPPSSTTFVLCSVVDPQNELVISLPPITASSLRTRVGSRQTALRQGGRHWQDCASVQRRNADTQHSELRWVIIIIELDVRSDGSQQVIGGTYLNVPVPSSHRREQAPVLFLRCPSRVSMSSSE